MNSCTWEMSIKRLVAAVSLGIVLLVGSAGAISSAWIKDGDGSWTNAANWNNGVPVSAGDAAYITNPVTAVRTITVDTNAVVKSIIIGGSTNSFTLNAGTGTLTLDSGGTGDALLQQNTGSAKSTIGANITLNSDLDIINRAPGAAYFNVNSAFSGSHNIFINPGVPTGGAPNMGTSSPSLVGNFTICYGQWLFNGGDGAFGCLSNGTRSIIVSNNAFLRNNGSLSALTSNRQIVVGIGGGGWSVHGKNVTLPYAAQLAGTNTFTLLTDANGYMSTSSRSVPPTTALPAPCSLPTTSPSNLAREAPSIAAP